MFGDACLQNYLEFGAFRAYLGKKQPPPNTTPDGKVVFTPRVFFFPLKAEKVIVYGGESISPYLMLDGTLLTTAVLLLCGCMIMT